MKVCNNCSKEYESKSNNSKFCSIDCRDEFKFKKRQSELLKGEEGTDYVIDKWNGYATPRIYGRWMKSMHPGKTTEDYLAEFPNAPLCCQKDLNATSKNSGKHMKDPKYRKMASEAIRGARNPNHKSRVSEDVRQSRSPFSKSFIKYETADQAGEFQLKHCHKGVSSNILEWWVNKGYSLEEAKQKLKDRQTTFSLEKCIKKYGKEKGTQIFNERQQKWKKSLHENFEREGDGRSPSSKFANEIIKEICNHLGIEIPEKEKWIRDKETGNAYSYDFTYENKIIEFNGDYWHCNPKIYEAEYFNKNKEMTALEIWQYDKEKIKTAEKYGYSVLTIWEHERNQSPEETLKKCIEFLHD